MQTASAIASSIATVRLLSTRLNSVTSSLPSSRPDNQPPSLWGVPRVELLHVAARLNVLAQTNRTQFDHFGPQKFRSVEVAERIMARNFGVPRQIDRYERAPLWPMWVLAFAMIGIIHAATFLRH
jgi:hypothetical protein